MRRRGVPHHNLPYKATFLIRQPSPTCHIWQVLGAEPRNAKALYRRASANSALSRPEAAIADLEVLAAADPANRAAAGMLARLRRETAPSWSNPGRRGSSSD